jgi:hypothetical protein
VNSMNTQYPMEVVDLAKILVMMAASGHRTAISVMISTVKLVQDGVTVYVRTVKILLQVGQIAHARQTSMAISTTVHFQI